jgi:hypothetical protein
MPLPQNTLTFVGTTPVDMRKQPAMFCYCAATETVIDQATGSPIAGLQIIAPAAVTGPVILTNRGQAGTGTQQIVNYTIVPPAGTAWVPFFAPATIGGGAKVGDVLTVTGVPAGTTVRLIYR